MGCKNNFKCRTCEQNLLVAKKTNTMQKNVEYIIVMDSGDINYGDKDYYWYMERYGDIMGVCEAIKCTD